MRLRQRWPRGLAAVLVIGVLAPAMLGLAWLVAGVASSPLRTDAAVEPLVVPVGSGTRDQLTSVLLTVEHAEPFQVTATGSGLVTDVHAGVGDEVAVGDPLVSVDDRVRVAFTAPAPLWRDIGVGDQGDDVERVREFLTELGFPAGTIDGRATEATVEGIRQFNQSIGRGTTDRILHRETLLWVGPEPLVIHNVQVRVGDVVNDGTSLFEGPPQPASIAVELPDERDWPDAEHVLAVGEVAVPYDPATGRVDEPEAVQALAGALRGRAEGAGTVRLAAAATVGTLPATAVVTDADGRTCVFESVTGPPIPVEVSGGSLSTVEVPADWVGRPVLVNPREVRQDLSCG